MNNEDVGRLERLCQRHTGVRAMDFVNNPGITTPHIAWRHVIRMASKPSMVFSDNHTSKAQDQWWKLVFSNGLLSDQASGLLSIGGLGGLPWARVWLSAGAPVFDIFALDKGSPEFLLMNEEGSRFLAVTSEEDETWLYLVDCHEGQLKTLSVSAG